jgi:hypothetical protein
MRRPAEGRRLVGVAPAHAAKRHYRLLRALEAAFPVTFGPLEAGRASGLDGLLVLGGEDPVDLARLPDSCALLIAGGQPIEGAAREALVEFAEDPPVAYPLRERELKEQSALSGRSVGSVPRDVILARAGGTPVWWCQGGAAWRHESAFAPRELADRETLREHFKAGRFMGLVAVVHFLWRVCGELESGPRRLHASFVIDDPNLHWPSYGHLRYRELARHAVEHGYHVGLAMVPLDGWLTSGRAASLLRSNEAFLSLLMHGNNHTSRELGELARDEQAARVLGQALRRIARFEERSGVRVRRVMAPPHGACSEAAARAMFRLGFEAVCVSRAYPWRDGMRPLSGADGWFPAEMAAGGLPVLPRYPISGAREDLIFRALLGQPLILYGHHGDLAGGLDTFARTARDVSRLGEVTWGPLDAIARSNYLAGSSGGVLLVRMHSRRASVEVPPGVSWLLVSVPVMHGDPLWSGVSCDSGEVPMRRVGAGWVSQRIPVTGGSRVELYFGARQPLDPNALESPRCGAWPTIRRLLVEGRDRARPLTGMRRG